MHPDLSTVPSPRHRHEARALFEAAVAAVSPARFVPPLLPPVPETGRIVVMAAGKAAGSMALAAEAHYLDACALDPSRLTGLAIARHGYGLPLRVLTMREAGHPVPDAAGLEATRAFMALAETCTAEDCVIMLLSGGASANLVAPMGAITLAEKQGLTRALLRSGADIQEINCVRKHLSAIKGGRLARMVAPARLLTIALSDVPGDDLSAIGSGPTVPDGTSLADARAILTRYGIDVPASIAAVLADPASETPKAGDAAFQAATACIGARPSDGLAAAIHKAEELGYHVQSLGDAVEGEARDVAAHHAALALAAKQAGRRIAILSGGELTVTIRGSGRGGPNQEYALALALALKGASGITVLAADTDGTDGGGGLPTDPAGAFVDETTLTRAKALGLDAAAMLANNDSTGFFEALGDLHSPGPTRTNANDLRVLLIGGDDA